MAQHASPRTGDAPPAHAAKMRHATPGGGGVGGAAEMGGATHAHPAAHVKEVTKAPTGAFNCTEIAAVHMALKIEGQCYIKNHLLLLIAPDDTGVLHEWHERVTKPNLDALVKAANEIGLSLPCPTLLEQRETEIKRKLSGGAMTGVLTAGEALLEIKTAACVLHNLYGEGFVMAENPHVRTLFHTLAQNVCNNVHKVADALKQTDEFFPIPRVAQMTLMDSGLHARK